MRNYLKIIIFNRPT